MEMLERYAAINRFYWEKLKKVRWVRRNSRQLQMEQKFDKEIQELDELQNLLREFAQ